jgi:hypothetical protein
MESWSTVGLTRTKTGVFHVTIRITQSRQLTSCLPLHLCHGHHCRSPVEISITTAYAFLERDARKYFQSIDVRLAANKALRIAVLVLSYQPHTCCITAIPLQMRHHDDLWRLCSCSAVP